MTIGTATITTGYVYDGAGRLTSETGSDGNAVAYAYDDYGNRSLMTVTGTVARSVTYSYDAACRLSAETSVAGGITDITRHYYDADGNLICRAAEKTEPAAGTAGSDISVSGDNAASSGVTIYAYDGLSRLIKTTSGTDILSFTYDGDGLRTGKTVNGAAISHAWDGDQIALELNGAGTVTSKYIRVINLIAAENISGTRTFYLFNGHGDVVRLTDGAGITIRSYTYDAFGVEKNIDNSDTNPFRYCGEYFDKETGTIYLRARYYDPAIGRFISEDSYWGKDRDPLSLNLYVYCGTRVGII